MAGLYNYCISLCFTTSVAIFVILLTLHHVYRVITDSSGSASKVKPPQGTLKSSTSGGSRGRSKVMTRCPSDLESVRTEDFEKQFHNIMVKHVASVPITSFDHLMVDSDLDTVKSHIIHERFQSALGE